ncbi:MAG: DUF547 domain-containing protein [Flavobacteriales bacterium]
MKYLLLAIGLFSYSFIPMAQNGPSTEELNAFYSEVVKNGLVDYDLALQRETQLNEIVTAIGTADISSLTRNEQQAFYINAYNVLVVKGILNNYPLNSPLDAAGFYKTVPYSIIGNSWTLDYLENEVLRKEFMDARIHFALVCGALGCPRIRAMAYTGNNLDAQLDEQSSLAMNNGWFVYENSQEQTVYASQIFDWFADDFGGKSNITTYINLFRTKPFNTDYKVKFYDYDWRLNKVGSGGAMLKNALEQLGTPPTDDEFNLQTFTGGSLLKHKQLDLTSFNTIYTHTKVNWMGQRFDENRETFATHLLQATYGISKSGRFNIGVEANFKASANRRDLSAGSVFDVYNFANDDSTRVGFTNVGLRLKVQPFKAVRNFSIQSTISVPTIGDPEGTGADRYFIDWDRMIVWNQFFFDKAFGDFQLFTSVETLFRVGIRSEQSSAVDLPVKAFFSYFPTDKITFYVMTEHVPRFRYNPNPVDLETGFTDDITSAANYTASGAGFKYQVGNRLNMELLYTNFWRSKNAGLGNTFNLGLKYILN